jgi:hypothetical protein
MQCRSIQPRYHRGQNNLLFHSTTCTQNIRSFLILIPELGISHRPTFDITTWKAYSYPFQPATLPDTVIATHLSSFVTSRHRISLRFLAQSPSAAPPFRKQCQPLRIAPFNRQPHFENHMCPIQRLIAGTCMTCSTPLSRASG